VSALLENVLALADDADSRVRYQVAYSLGETKDPRGVEALARIARRDAVDPWIRAAVLSSAAQTAHELLIQLLNDRRFLASSTGYEIAEKLAFIVGARNHSEERDSLFDALARLRNPADRRLQSQIVEGVGDGLKQVNAHLELPADTKRPGDGLLHALVDQAKQTVTNVRKTDENRVADIRLLGCFQRSVSGPMLTGLITPENSERVQMAAVGALAGYGDADIASTLLDRWKEYSPGVRIEVVRTLVSREPWTLAYLRFIQKAPAAASPLDPVQRSRLLAHKSKAVREQAEALFGRQAASPRSSVVAEYRSCLALKGDVAGGRAIYERECSICHQIGSTGYEIGPSLASSNARAPEALVMHILDPSQYIPPQYVQYVAVDRNGRTYTGIVASQNSTSISLKREKGAVDTLLRSNLEELTSTGKSLMPEGFEKKLSKQDMANLIAYLQTVQAGVPAADPPLDIGTRPGLMEP
jgi:putative heme-binding domain-containing protein